MSSGAPFENGTPIRMPSTAILCIDSADSVRYNNDGYIINATTPADIYINKQTPLMFGYMTRVSLTDININWDTPNVNDRNNTLTIRIADVSGYASPSNIIGTYRIAIPTQFRTPDNIANIVRVSLNNLTISGMTGVNAFQVVHFPAQAEFVVVIDNTLTTAPRYLSILPPGKTYDIDGVYPSGSFKGKVDDDLTYMMGYSHIAELKNYFTESIASSFASCQYTPYIDIVSTFLTKNQNVRDNDSSLRNGQAKLARVYLSHPGANNQFSIDDDGVIISCNIVGVRPFVLHKEFENPKVISWNTTENIDIVDLKVLDHRGNAIFIEQSVVSKSTDLVKLGNTASFQFTLQITEV
jgi:hypothetical protein